MKLIMGALARGMLAMVFALEPTIAVAKMSPDDLVGYWRPQFEDHPQPDLSGCSDATDKQVCERHQGTYLRRPYFQIDITPDGKLVLISDGMLWAELTQNPQHASRFDIRFGESGTARLHLGSDNCIGVDRCFEINRSSDTGLLANDVYTPMKLREPDDVSERTDGDNFSNIPVSFDLAVRCYDITKMDLEDFQNRADCQQHIFIELNEMKNTTDYYISTNPGHGPVVVPLGWRYEQNDGGAGGGRTRILESESDVNHSESQKIGFKSGLNLLGLDFSFSRTKATKERVQDMADNKVTYAQYEFIQTHSALVLEKENARLNPDFHSLVANTLAKQKKPNYSRLIEKFGTHYSYATTMGATGRLFSRMTYESVVKLHESGTDIKTGMSAGVTIPTEAGKVSESGDGNSAVSKSDQDQMKSILGDDFGQYVCFGGTSCDGREAKGDAWVPVLLDLRPLSDLLGPPFFQEIDSAKLRELQTGLAKAITDYAFTETGASRNPAAQFLRVATEQRGYDFDGLILSCKTEFEGVDQKSSNNFTTGFCGPYQNTTLVTNRGMMAYLDNTDGAAGVYPKAAEGKPLVVLPGDEITVATTVVRPAMECSISAYNNFDRSPVAHVAEGKGKVPTPPTGPSPGAFHPGKEPATPLNVREDQVWMTVELDKSSCKDEVGSQIVRGGAFASIVFDIMTASELLQ